MNDFVICGDSDDSSESSDICVDNSVLSDHSDANVGSDASDCEFGVDDLETAPAQPTARARRCCTLPAPLHLPPPSPHLINYVEPNIFYSSCGPCHLKTIF
ncbi:hypothetical protein J6590_024114 [Homalodisca vitripennis]|nr:hypothetical protein J6590_024114 [Homalodisca vitripennis]